MIRGLAVKLAVIAALVAGGCGGDGGDGTGDGPLVWVEPPYAGTPSRLLPDDHVVLGRVRNDSRRRVKVHYTEVRLVDADGRRVRGSARFTETWGHSLYPPEREPESVRSAEDLRIGRAVDLEPGQTAPLMVAWRGRRRAAAIDYGHGLLPIPADSASTPGT